MLTQPVGVGDLELELRDDPEHPDGDLGRVQQVEVRLADLAHVAGRRHEAYAAHDAGQAGVARAGAVRPGRHGAGDLLGVDVALVAQRQPDLPQRFVEVADQRAGERGGALGRDVGADDAPQCREVEQQAVGPDHRREGVTGARDADTLAALGGLAHEGGDLVLVARSGGRSGREGLVAHPVGPGHAGQPDQRRTCRQRVGSRATVPGPAEVRTRSTAPARPWCASPAPARRTRRGGAPARDPRGAARRCRGRGSRHRGRPRRG